MITTISFIIGLVIGTTVGSLTIYVIREEISMAMAREFKCPVCKKVFYVNGIDWVYKYKKKYVCSYHCTKGKEGKKEYDRLWATKDGSHI